MLTQEIVRELLHYNPETGVLTWKERGRHWFFRDKDWHWWNKRFSLQEAGGVTSKANGYARRSVHIKMPGEKSKGYRSHRVAWLWMTGICQMMLIISMAMHAITDGAILGMLIDRQIVETGQKG